MPQHVLINSLLASLPPPMSEALLSDARQSAIAQGAILYEAGGAIDHIYFPQSGLISLLVMTDNGGMIEAASIGREGGLGLQRGLGARNSFTRAVAQVGGVFYVLTARRFEQYARDHEPVREMIGRHNELLIAQVQQLAACNLAHDASSRLARWLLQCAERTGSEMVPLTQEFLAQMLGVQRTTVTLLAQELQHEGLIQYSRGRITILDRPGLVARACECYHVLQDDVLHRRLGLKT
jgi:CRP-like cAMP-binding protein